MTGSEPLTVTVQGRALERATRLAEVMSADPVLSRPGDPEWTVQHVIDAAIRRGLDAMEVSYPPGVPPDQARPSRPDQPR